jgi:RNA polymerase sigma-70 factor, ECF subfamily
MSDIKALAQTLQEGHARFSKLVESIRPDLHRYCSRMTGSVLDGEDVVQETLAQAYYALALLHEDVPLRPWLFTIAHHKCVDFLRSRAAWATIDVDERNEPVMEMEKDIENHELAAQAFSSLVLVLPARERASVLLKDVLGYSLPEIAKILETSVGAVKAALHRGREKLASVAHEPAHRREPLPPSVLQYIETFNRRDWVGITSLLEEDVRCELVGFVHLSGREVLEKHYLSTYGGGLSYAWRFASGTIDGEPAIVCLREDGGRWLPRHAIRLDWRGGRVARIRDYAHVPYLFREGGGVVVDIPLESRAAKTGGGRHVES